MVLYMKVAQLCNVLHISLSHGHEVTNTIILGFALVILHLFASADITIIEKHFLKKQLNDDVPYLTITFERVHPQICHSISKQTYQRWTGNVQNAVRMTERQAWPFMARLVGNERALFFQ